MSRIILDNADVLFIEPCNNWSGCHVMKQYHMDRIFMEETEVKDKDMKVSSRIEQWISLYLIQKIFDAAKSERIAELQALGSNNQDEMSEFSVKFYYTNQVRYFILWQ